MSERSALFPLREKLERISEGEASELSLEPEDATVLLRFLNNVQAVLDWYRDNETVPSLDVRLKLLWRSHNRIQEIDQ